MSPQISLSAEGQETSRTHRQGRWCLSAVRSAGPAPPQGPPHLSVEVQWGGEGRGGEGVDGTL